MHNLAAVSVDRCDGTFFFYSGSHFVTDKHFLLLVFFVFPPTLFFSLLECHTAVADNVAAANKRKRTLLLLPLSLSFSFPFCSVSNALLHTT